MPWFEIRTKCRGCKDETSWIRQADDSEGMEALVKAQRCPQCMAQDKLKVLWRERHRRHPYRDMLPGHRDLEGLAFHTI